MINPVLPADPVEEHLNRRVEEPAGEHLAVVGQDLFWHPVGLQRGDQPVTDRLRPLSRHQPRRHAEPGVVIDTGQRLGPRPVGQRETADHIHLPQLHRRRPLPPLPDLLAAVPASRVDHPGPHQRPVDP